MMSPCQKNIVTNLNASEFIDTFWVQNVKILIFCFAETFLKNTFNPDNNFHWIFMMLQINKTKHLNLAENVIFMKF